uniref:Retrotransposon gag domain-containing protein n=1 Tax=Cajanus cajan TaxID=3821 RepID=A0A151TAW6_CAJCA|nr:hypothetical protein KK1_018779 [Cajanus cajan]
MPLNLGRPHRNLEEDLDQIVERVLNRHGVEVGRNEHPYFVSTFLKYITQSELPKGLKVPKFSKFAGELGESSVEHIARYLVKCGDLVSNEHLKMKYFPSSLTKHAFTWFTTLQPNSIITWTQLERSFHDHFFRGEMKVSIVDLMNVKRQHNESLDDYLNRFRQLKSRCYTNILEHELVKIVATGLDFLIRKNLFRMMMRVYKYSKLTRKRPKFKLFSSNFGYMAEGTAKGAEEEYEGVEMADGSKHEKKIMNDTAVITVGEFLGFIIHQKGIKVDKNKTKE